LGGCRRNFVFLFEAAAQSQDEPVDNVALTAIRIPGAKTSQTEPPELSAAKLNPAREQGATARGGTARAAGARALGLLVIESFALAKPETKRDGFDLGTSASQPE
jgi:hypothetical protein